MTSTLHATPVPPEDRVRDFYVDALRTLDDVGLPYLVGGGYAMAYYTGIRRNTKDLDIFVKAADHRKVLNALAHAGYRTEYFYPFWIAKALQGDDFIDILYNSGNGVAVVDDDWFKFSIAANVLGYDTRLCPAEEQLWSKAFVQDRDRFDGADVAHLILRQGESFDWKRLLRRFAGHEPVLLAHCVMFHYIYPTERRMIPEWVMEHLHTAARQEPSGELKLCRGTLVSQLGFTHDIEHWNYLDGRLSPHGPLSPQEIDQLPK